MWYGLLFLLMLVMLGAAPLAVRAAPRAEDVPPPEPTLVALPMALTPQLQQVEPRSFSNTTAATLSISGSGFITTTLARLVGYGLLETTYVSENWLKAHVPSGIPAGRYELEVFNAAAVSNRIAIDVTAPALPATPPPAPQPGRPILTVRNFSVDPARVRAGQEFVVTIEIYNNGSRAGENTLAVFTGGNFLPVGENGHALWQLHINHTAVVAQRMRAPATMSSGVHQLSIALSASDFSGEHYEYPTTISVEVIGSTATGPATGRPRVVIEAAATDPAELVPGEPFTLTLSLANRGNFAAVNVLAASASAEMAIPAVGSDAIALNRIAVNEALTLTLPLVLGDVDKGGRQNLKIALAYSDHTGAAYSDQQHIGVDVNTSLANRPQLLVREYRTTPEHLLPGEMFTLTVTIANVGGMDARQVTLALGGKQGEALEPFIAVGAGNVLFIPEVRQGQTAAVEQRLIVDGAATPKAYNLPVEVAYDDPRGARQSEVQRMSLVVRRRVDIEPRFYREPGALRAGQPTALEMEVGNLGRSAVNIVGITASSPQMEVRLTGLPFAGSLDANGTAPLDLELVPHAGGPAELLITVAYRDDFNQTQTRSWTYAFAVQDAPAPTLAPDSAVPETAPVLAPHTFWDRLLRTLRGLLGIGS